MMVTAPAAAGAVSHDDEFGWAIGLFEAIGRFPIGGLGADRIHACTINPGCALISAHVPRECSRSRDLALSR
jgi:hypothetical protein